MDTHGENAEVTPDRLDTAGRFAHAIGHAEFEAARSLLSDDCVYRLPGETIVGPVDILARYRVSDEQARATFDHVTYRSSVEPQDDGRVRITFRDCIEHHGVSVLHTAHETLAFDDRGKICRIEHADARSSPDPAPDHP